jgi:biopolymer transport protein TolQ
METAHDFSMIGLFMQADWVVKSVMIGLLLASIWCWAIIANRLAVIAKARREMAELDAALREARTLEDLSRRVDAIRSAGLSSVFEAAMTEWERSAEISAISEDGLRQRIATALELAVSEQGARLTGRLGNLATIGSAGPFIGLFGTVWGIMNAFTSIAEAQNTSLAVVAPGIAEALLATALGLVAAIPAVIAYNKIGGDISALTARLSAFAERLAALMSRLRDAEKAA